MATSSNVIFCVVLMRQNSVDVRTTRIFACRAVSGCFQPVFALHMRVISGFWTGLGRGLSSLVEDEVAEIVTEVGQCHASCGPRLTD